MFNPMFHMIDAFRTSYTGHGDVPLSTSLSVVVSLTVISVAIALTMTARGVKLRT